MLSNRSQDPAAAPRNVASMMAGVSPFLLRLRLRSQVGLIEPVADNLFALIIFALVFGVLGLGADALWQAHLAKRASYEKAMEVREIYEAHQKWERNAYAYIVPAFDSTGAANNDAHEYAECFTSVDSGGRIRDNYYAWRFNAAAKTLQEVAYDAPSTGAGVAATNVRPISHVYPNIISAQGTITRASSLPAVLFGGHTPIDAPVTMCNNAQGGNVGLDVTYDNGYLQVDQRLKTRLDVSGFTVNVGTFTRGPLVRDPVKLVYVRAGDTNPTATYANGTVAADPNGVMSMSELHYYPVAGGPAGNGVFTIDTSACGANVAASPASVSANDATSVYTGILGQQWATNCMITVRDDHGGALQTQVIVYGPLVVAPTTLLFLGAGAPAQTVTVHETYYPGGFGIANNTCGGAIGFAGGGNGPDATYSITPLAPTGGCSFTVFDDHGGTQVVSVKTYGPLSVTPNALTFNSPTAPAQGTTAHEDFYPGVITTDLTTPGGGYPGCAGYATIDSSGRATNGSWDAPFAITPQAATVPAGKCMVTYRDDHGNVVQAAVQITSPVITCPDGTVVPYGTPCTLVPSGTVTSLGDYGNQSQPPDPHLGGGFSIAYFVPAMTTVTTSVPPNDATHALNITVGGGSTDTSSNTINMVSCTATYPAGSIPVSTHFGKLWVGIGAPPGGTYYSTISITDYGAPAAPYSLGYSFSYYDPAATAGTYTITLFAPPCGPNFSAANFDWTFSFPVMVTQTQ